MRIFVYEYTCAAAPVPSSLRIEGRAMLTAVAEDFARAPGVELTALLHEDGGQEPNVPGCRWVRARDEERVCRTLAGTAAYSLIIAPEFDDLLATRCDWVRAAGGRLLGSSLAAVRLTADKLALGRHWHQHGVATPSCHLLTDFDATPASLFPLVLKPRHGAGSQATLLARHAGDLVRVQDIFREEMAGSEALVQPFAPGLAASVAFLIGPRGSVPLLPAAQHLSADGRFRYQGGAIPLPPALAERAVRAARSAVAAVPGLQGYVGVDLVLGTNADGSGDQVIEINPRLTTSYIGLRALARTNLALAMVEALEGADPLRIAWRDGAVRFLADGSVDESAATSDPGSDRAASPRPFRSPPW